MDFMRADSNVKRFEYTENLWKDVDAQLFVTLDDSALKEKYRM